MCDCFSPYLHATPEALRSPYPFPSFSCLILSFPIGKVHFDKRGHFVYNGPLPRNLNKALTVEVSLIVLFVLCLFFFIAGFVDSVAGGGGLISTPSMLLCGIPPHVALGTGKFASTLGSLSSLWTFARNHLVVMRIAPAGFVSAFLGGMLGSALAMRVPSDMLGKVLIFLLPVGMVISLFSGRLVTQEGELPERGLWVRVILMGLLIGAYDGFFGPGTGSFFIIMQHLVLRMGLVRASATAKVFNLASNAGAFAVFATGGVTHFMLGLPLAAANILGNQLGTRLAIRIGARMVRNFLYVTLTLLLSTLVYRFFFS